jgi:hypothetical protein
MANSDRVEQFFDELGRRGHEPLLDRMDAIGLVELYDGDRTARWLVAVRGGYITVSKDGADAGADWVMKADRRAFERVIHGDAGALAALIRGTLSVQLVDPQQKFGLITRLFAGPPGSRKEWTEDESLNQQAPVADGEPAR